MERTGTMELAGPARQTDSAVPSITEQLRGASGRLGETPLAAVERVALLLALAVALVPVLVVSVTPAAAVAVCPGRESGGAGRRQPGEPRPFRAARAGQPADTGAREGQRPGGQVADGGSRGRTTPRPARAHGGQSAAHEHTGVSRTISGRRSLALARSGHRAREASWPALAMHRDGRLGHAGRVAPPGSDVETQEIACLSSK